MVSRGLNTWKAMSRVWMKSGSGSLIGRRTFYLPSDVRVCVFTKSSSQLLSFGMSTGPVIGTSSWDQNLSIKFKSSWSALQCQEVSDCARHLGWYRRPIPTTFPVPPNLRLQCPTICNSPDLRIEAHVRAPTRTSTGPEDQNWIGESELL